MLVKLNTNRIKDFYELLETDEHNRYDLGNIVIILLAILAKKMIYLRCILDFI